MHNLHFRWHGATRLACGPAVQTARLGADAPMSCRTRSKGFSKVSVLYLRREVGTSSPTLTYWLLRSCSCSRFWACFWAFLSVSSSAQGARAPRAA